MSINQELQRILHSGSFSREQIADVAATLMLLEDRPPSGPREQEILRGLLERAKLSPELDAEQAGARLVAYFEGQPTERLFTCITQLVRESMTTRGRGGGSYAALLGGKAIPSVLVRGARPPGTVAAGPAARFEIQALPRR